MTWDTIECIERNGIITGYTVVFQEQGRANVPGNIVDRTFSATELTPFTNHTFQVAGVNDVGTGPFTDIITITTDEEGFVFIVSNDVTLSISTQFLVLCLTSLPCPSSHL